MARSGLSFTYTDYSVFKVVDGRLIELGVRHLPCSLSYYDLLQRGYTIGTLSVVIERELLGGERFKKIGHEDFAMWLRLLRLNSAIAYKVPSTRCLAKYRVSANSVSSSKIRAARWMWSILSVEERLGFRAAAFGFLRYAFRSTVRLA
jgi:hypothetical protein